MSRTDELRRRVERLLSGHRNTADLYAVFLWLRERSFGNRAVADVGDFVAHSEDRNQGVAWKAAQHFYNAMQFLLPRLSPDHDLYTIAPIANPRGTSDQSTVEEFKAAAWANFENTDPAVIRADTGLGMRKARAVLTAALENVERFQGDAIYVKIAPTPAERHLIHYLTTRLVVRPAFNSDQLVSQLWACLAKNKLIAEAGEGPPQAFANFVSLYAVERMHRARIILANGRNADLSIAAASPNRDSTEQYLSVVATSPVLVENVIHPVMYSVYITDLKPEDWCEPELLEMGREWDCPLEIGPSGKLQKL